jgi:lysine-N-methylase
MFYEPYFEQRPYVLENYVVNYIFQNLFPFGRQGSADFLKLSVWGEYLQMVARFAWLQGLLVGVAGCFKQAFANEHVVQVVQAVTRCAEHYPEILASLNRYMQANGLDDLEALEALLGAKPTKVLAAPHL